MSDLVTNWSKSTHIGQTSMRQNELKIDLKKNQICPYSMPIRPTLGPNLNPCVGFVKPGQELVKDWSSRTCVGEGGGDCVAADRG